MHKSTHIQTYICMHYKPCLLYGYGYGILFNVGELLALGATILGAHQIVCTYICIMFN